MIDSSEGKINMIFNDKLQPLVDIFDGNYFDEKLYFIELGEGEFSNTSL
jgi:hypothetical protein